MTQAKRAWLLCALWMAVIFLFSAMPGDLSEMESGFFFSLLMRLLSFLLGDYAARLDPALLHLLVRKGAHMAEYFVLFLLYRRALRLSGAKRPGLMALLLCAAYAATDEFHQSFVDDRGPSPVDVAIDTAGACIAWVAAGCARAGRARTHLRNRE